MKIYIAAPLFNEIELERNRKMRVFLNGLGFETYLPQEDGGVSFDLIKSGGSIGETRKKIFDNDMEEVRNSDIILCVLDGRVPDEGMCVELGFAHALGKTCLGYQTDQRSLDAYGLNLMIEGCLRVITHSFPELEKVLENYK
jgi:nucleoside 2-deoxyribosyltransferase